MAFEERPNRNRNLLTTRELGKSPSEPDKPLRAKRCGTCDAFEPPEANKEMGLCRHELPICVPMPGRIPGEVGAVSIWPPVKPGHWCLKWVPILEKQPELPFSSVNPPENR